NIGQVKLRYRQRCGTLKIWIVFIIAVPDSSYAFRLRRIAINLIDYLLCCHWIISIFLYRLVVVFAIWTISIMVTSMTTSIICVFLFVIIIVVFVLFCLDQVDQRNQRRGLQSLTILRVTGSIVVTMAVA